MESEGTKKIGVFLLQHGEPETFKFNDYYTEFKKMFLGFKNTNVPVPPRILWPFLAWRMRSHYRGAGGRSSHIAVAKKQLELLRKELSECTIYMGYMKYLEPSITTTINQMIRDGYMKIITLPLMLTESSYTEEIIEILEQVKKEQEGIDVLLSRPLFYKADSLAPMCAQLILNKVGDTPIDQVGVLLVSHGEPDEWVRLKLINTRCNEQETAFRKMIRRELITLGFKDANITDAFMEFVPPRITTAIEKIAHTVERIIILPAFGQAESLHNTYDIPTKVRNAKVPSETNITWITSWAVEPNLIRSLADLYRDALQGRTYQSPEL